MKNHFPLSAVKLKFTREESPENSPARYNHVSQEGRYTKVPFHPIDNPDGTRRVQASLAGRSHFNRGAEVLTWKVQVCAVQVCVRAWPTCRGRAAHYSNPCVAVCARCPPPAYIISPRQVQCTHLQRGLVPLSPGLGQIST